jgi:N-acetyl-gamma-glutamyl-phosphate reductase
LPGCHATGFILSARPLIDAGLIGADYPFAIHSVTGYSGGGKTMIAAYEAAADERSGARPEDAFPHPATDVSQGKGDGQPSGSYPNADQSRLLSAPRAYALSQAHKHLPEMAKMAGLSELPLFSPHVANFYSGLSVVLPLHGRLFLEAGFDSAVDCVWESLSSRYEGERLITVHPLGTDTEAGFLSAISMSRRNDLEIFVTGNAQRAVVTARYDNLGKGASGAAIQCMNIMLGIEETKGLA